MVAEPEEDSPINAAVSSNIANTTAPTQNGRDLVACGLVGDEAMLKYRFVQCRAL
jgi:hypothetical protein